MRFGYSETCLAHDPGNRHPETPDRLRAVRQALVRKHAVEYHEAPPATDDALAAVHDGEYLEAFREFCADGGGSWDPDTVAVERTWEAAVQSAGLAVWAAEEAVGGATGRTTPFSLGRPPGHHATADEAMGFCFLNNVAIAAQSVIDAGTADGVAIVDWDAHHGNGTQSIFYERGDVLYVSVHEGELYPGTGQLEETGRGAGAGATVNLPLPAGADNAAYRAAFDEVIGPVLRRATPDLLLVSAGFDAHRHDPISRLRLTTDGFGMLARRIRGVVEALDAGLGFVLEGGYSLDMLASGVGMVHEVFDGYEPELPNGAPSEEVRRRLETSRQLHGLA